MTLRCLLGHATSLVEGETLGLLGCSRCGYVERVWRLLRPEIGHVAARQKDAARRERDQRAARMGSQKNKIEDLETWRAGIR